MEGEPIVTLGGIVESPEILNRDTEGDETLPITNILNRDMRSDGVWLTATDNPVPEGVGLDASNREFLLFLSMAMWLLERYPKFERHLDNCYRKVADQEDAL